MKRIINLSAILVLLSVFTTTAFAQEESTVKLQNGKMVRAQSMQGTATQSENWVDTDGNGICDNVGTELQGQGNGRGYGLKDGSKSGTSPQDGTGYGKLNGGGNGTGICTADGTGSGTQKRTGKK